MIEYISGQLVENLPGLCVVENQGIGYRIVTLPTAFGQFPEAGKVIKIYIHQHIHEDTRAFFGFLSPYERNIFTLLLTVSGIGPKLAHKALTEMPAKEIVAAIHQGREQILKRIKGLGPKIVAKMILDLKDKAGNYLSDAAKSESAGPLGEVRFQTEEALRGLGYKEGEIRSATSLVFAERANPTLEEAIRQALFYLGKG